jgi:D-alanyl-D-alanine dipeptidase
MRQIIHCESIPGHPDFRPLASIAGVQVELRYATPDNFVGRDLYSPLDCAWLHKDAAGALASALARLQHRRPDLTFLILDAMRPQRVQEQLWAALQGTELLQYLANPERGSIHSFGMAVDITLATHDGVEQDMGTPFDDLTELSHPALEAGFLATGALTVAQVENRVLLRDAMHAAGFAGINSEWWHFDCGDRLKVRAEYARIL